MNILFHMASEDYQRLSDFLTREKLAKKIGLRNIPKLDSAAFDRLAGMLGKRIKPEKIDAVEIVRVVRGSQCTKSIVSVN